MQRFKILSKPDEHSEWKTQRERTDKQENHFGECDTGARPGSWRQKLGVKTDSVIEIQRKIMIRKR